MFPMESISKVIGKTIDKLPTWAKVIVWVGTAVGCVYYISCYGLGSFLLRMIFSP